MKIDGMNPRSFYEVTMNEKVERWHDIFKCVRTAACMEEKMI